MLKGTRMFWSIVKRCNAEKFTIGFLISFLLVSLVIMLVEPDVVTYTDAIWYTFVSCTTIGFGDIVVTTHLARILTVYITIYELILVAIFSGVIVSHYLEVVKKSEELTATQFLDKLEHLSELDKEELKEVEEKVKNIRKHHKK